MATRAREIADRMEAEQTGKAWNENLLSRALKRAVSTPRTEEEMSELTREVARGERAPQRMAKGGSASSRADGIAKRGKTRGTMVACGGGYMKGKK